MTPFLEVTDIDIAYPPKRVVEGVSFKMAEAAIGCLLGPSAVSYTHLDVYKRQRLYHRLHLHRLAGFSRAGTNRLT